MSGPAEEPLLVETGKGFSVKWRDRFLYSSRDPLDSVRRRIARWEPEPDTLYLLPSPLLGYGIGELCERLPSRSFLLGVERFQELMALTQPHLPTELLDGERCQIIRTESIPALLRFAESLGLDRFRRCRRLDLTGGSRLDGDFYREAEEALGRLIFQHWQTRASLVRMGPLWFRNIFRNLPAFSTGGAVSNLKVDGPIVLCGAGESLEESLPLIRRYRKEIFLCAVDTAYPVLTGSDLIPDAVFNLDGQFYNLYDFYRHRENPIYLISDITACPASLRLKGIKPLFFSSRFARNSLLDKLEKRNILPEPLPPLGSVGVTALYLCTILGPGPYLFTGLDFSYKPGKSHARNTVFHRIFLSGNARLIPDGGLTSLSLRRPERRLPARISGKLLRSDTVLEGYYRSFREIAESLAGRAYQLEGDYPSLGVPALGKRELASIIGTGNALRVRNTPAYPKREEVTLFLSEETERLRDILKGWDLYLEKDDPLPLDQALASCDYPALTVGFARESRKDAYYSEAVKNARTYLSLLENNPVN